MPAYTRSDRKTFGECPGGENFRAAQGMGAYREEAIKTGAIISAVR